MDTGPSPRAGFDPAAPAPEGIDADGWFHAPADQSDPPAHVLRLLEDFDLAEAVLRDAEVVSVESIEAGHTLFRATLAPTAEHAEALGVESFDACFKPRGSDWYGREYRRELVYYRLARHLGAQGLVPMVERDVAWAEIAAQAEFELTPRQLEQLSTEQDEAGVERLRGSVQVWVEGYSDVIGASSTSGRWLRTLSAAIALDGPWPVDADPVWRSLSDMFVMDHLVYMGDRNHEVGSVRLPDGGQRLVMLDAGESLQWHAPDGSYQPWDAHFEQLRFFSSGVVSGLRGLDEDTLRALWTDIDGEPLTSESHVARVAGRAAAAVERIDALADEAGGPEYIVFPEPGPAP